MEERIKEISREILVLAQQELLLKLPFFSRVLLRIQFQSEEVPLAFDGHTVYYNPLFMIYSYRSDPKEPGRMLMHTLLHYVFSHPFVKGDINELCWDLSCDIAVEDALVQMQLSDCKEEKLATLMMLRNEILDGLTAEKVYKWFKDKGISNEEMEKERENFIADRHELWYAQSDQIEIVKEWNEVTHKLEYEITEEDLKGILLQKISRRKNRYTYHEFLRNFLTEREIIGTSSDFDYQYYMYGMELYGNMPLIEYLEYKEADKIESLVIVIDTSGSVQGEIVEEFVRKTIDILLNEKSGIRDFKVHVLQCDDEIREDVYLNNPESVHLYMEKMTIKGLGNTDFRPAFDYVEQLKKSGKLKDLKGLIYFTDGKGIFPSVKPSFPTAFVLNKDANAEVIPSWAEKYVLQEEDNG